MFKHQTVMILGAGASCEAGLPSGEALKQLISETLKLNDLGSGFSDSQIGLSAEKHAKELSGNDWRRTLGLYRSAAERIRAGLPLARSIDHFLDAHAGNENVEFMGKLAIASVILRSESESRLQLDKGHIDPSAIKGTWFAPFVQMLAQSTHRDNVDNIFNNLTIVSFNYDRCIEHFLYNALQSYFWMYPTSAAKLISRLRIIHPYGLVGVLPWQAGNITASFGDPEDSLPEIASSIKTFTQTVESGTAESVRDAILNARTLIFLGFGYHRQNMELLTPGQPTMANRIFATMGGISASDKIAARSLIRNVVGGGVRLHDHAVTCAGLFEDARLQLAEDLL